MAVNGNGNFQYPAQGWSTGKMRKRGQKLDQMAMDYQRRGQPESALAEMDKAAGMGIAARGGAVPGAAVTGVAQAPAGQQIGKDVQAQIQAHKDQIQDSLNQVAQGDMNMSGFNKLLKKLGWSQDPKTKEFTDPYGNSHDIAAEAQ